MTRLKIVLVLIFCIASFNICSAADITYYPKFRADDSNGEPMAFGQVYSYVPGTTTPKATYTSSTGDVANSNPVVLDNKGEADIYTVGPTKLVLKKKVGSFYVTQWEETVEGSSAILGNYKYPDYEATDQGAADATYTTVKDIIDGLAADEGATIFLPHNSGGVTTAYTFLTAETIPSNVTLEFENGAMLDVGLNIVTLNCGLIAGKQQIFVTGVATSRSTVWPISGDVKTPVIYPEWFGATGTSAAGEDYLIQQAIQMPDNPSQSDIRISAGTYWIDAETDYLQARSGMRLYLDKNAILRAEEAATSVYKILYIAQNTNVIVEGGQFIGDRYLPTSPTGESGHCISIGVDASDILISKCSLSAGRGDGVYVNNSTNINIDDCIIFDNRRNNISVVGDVNGVWITNNVIYEANGTNPEAGIDLEPNNTRTSTKIFVTGNEIYDCDGAGLSLTELGSGQLNEVIVSYNHIYDNDSQIKLNGCNNATIIGNTLDGLNGLFSTTSDDVTDLTVTSNVINGINMDMTASNVTGVVISSNTVTSAAIMIDINDLIFTGNKVSSRVEIENCPNFIASNNIVRSQTFKCLWIKDTVNGVVSGNAVTTPADYAGIELEGCESMSVTGNNIYDCGDTGILASGCTYLVINSNTFRGNCVLGSPFTNLEVENTSYSTINGNNFSDNSLSRKGLIISEVAGPSTSNLVTSNHWGDTTGFTDGGTSTVSANNTP